MSSRLVFGVLASSCILLTAAILMPLEDDVARFKPTAEQGSVSPKNMAGPQLSALSSYQDIIERPLFNSERTQMAVKKEVAKNISSTPEQIKKNDDEESPRLLGVMSVGSENRAFIVSDNVSVSSVAKGDSIQGWIVEEVDKNKVVMSRDGEEISVTIDWLGEDALKLNSKDNDE